MRIAQENGSACEHGFMFHDDLLNHTQGGKESSLVILEGAGLQTDLLQ